MPEGEYAAFALQLACAGAVGLSPAFSLFVLSALVASSLSTGEPEALQDCPAGMAAFLSHPVSLLFLTIFALIELVHPYIIHLPDRFSAPEKVKTFVSMLPAILFAFVPLASTITTLTTFDEEHQAIFSGGGDEDEDGGDEDGDRRRLEDDGDNQPGLLAFNVVCIFVCGALSLSLYLFRNWARSLASGKFLPIVMHVSEITFALVSIIAAVYVEEAGLLISYFYCALGAVAVFDVAARKREERMRGAGLTDNSVLAVDGRRDRGAEEGKSSYEPFEKGKGENGSIKDKASWW